MIMKFRKLFYVSLFILLLPCHLLAWGHAGHAMVAGLAMSMLSDATRVKVERVLNGMTPEQASWTMLRVTVTGMKGANAEPAAK